MGRGHFDARVASRLRNTAVSDDIGELSDAGEHDLAMRVLATLECMLGADDAGTVVAAASGKASGSVSVLRNWLAGGFFRLHLRQYRGRPVYWLLQSPQRCFSAYVHYEQLNASMLRTLQSSRYLGARITEARRCRDDDLLGDLRAFDAAIDRVLKATDERGGQVGWRLEPDDGVLINAAPLRELLSPVWQEPADCWHRLAAGEYDWSCSAARYWPDRVSGKCRTVRSVALAHGQVEGGKVV